MTHFIRFTAAALSLVAFAPQVGFAQQAGAPAGAQERVHPPSPATAEDRAFAVGVRAVETADARARGDRAYTQALRRGDAASLKRMLVLNGAPADLAVTREPNPPGSSGATDRHLFKICWGSGPGHYTCWTLFSNGATLTRE